MISQAMKKYNDVELLEAGHNGCPGCGMTVSLRMALKVLGPDIVLVVPASCLSAVNGKYPVSAIRVPVFHVPFASATATATGVRDGLDARGKYSTLVVVWGGDGGTFDIGLAGLSGAAERNDDIIYFCYDNEAYMNTGIQRSSATPWLAWTNTTPAPGYNPTFKKDIFSIMAAHRIPYAATLSPAYPEDFAAKVEFAKAIKGFKFLHIVSPCPTGWKTDEKDTINLARLAVQTGVFPLLEVINGEKWKITVEPSLKGVKNYLKLQGRFDHLAPKEIANIQRTVRKRYRKIEKKANEDRDCI